VDTTVERLESTTVRLVLSFDQAEVKRAFGKAYGDLSSQVAIPGFRPGKAPRMIIDQVLGREAVRGQVIGDLVPDAITETVDSYEFFVVGEPQLDYEEPQPDQPFTVAATLTVMPEVELGELSGLELVKPVIKPTEEQIDSIVEGVREQHSVSVDVDDRGVQQDDFVYVTYQVTVDGEAMYEPEELPSMFLQVGAHYYKPEIDADLIGMSTGESKDIPVTYPEDHNDDRLAGKSATFTATVDRVTIRQSAELDEAFFERVGVADFEALRDRARREWEDQANADVDGLVEAQVLAIMTERGSVDLPDTITSSRVEELEQEVQRRLRLTDSDMDTYLSERSQTLEQHQADLRRSAEREINQFLVIRAAAKQLDLEATDEDIEEAVWTLARSMNKTFSEMWEMLERTDTLDDMRTRRTTEKVLSHIIEQASIREVELTHEAYTEGEWARGIPGLAFIVGDDEDAETEPSDETTPGEDESPDAEAEAPVEETDKEAE
jgi:trigger factor